MDRDRQSIIDRLNSAHLAASFPFYSMILTQMANGNEREDLMTPPEGNVIIILNPSMFSPPLVHVSTHWVYA